MLLAYPAIFHKENNSYWVEFPDLTGCQTYGGSLNEALYLAQEALLAYTLALIEDGKPLPSPSDMENIDVSNSPHTFTSLVTCDIGQHAKSVKKTLTIPSWLNEKALSQGINFSKVLQEALLNKIQARN